MPSYSLNLNNVITTNSKPGPKYLHVDGVRTEKITGYSYRLIDMSKGEALNVTIPTEKTLTSGSLVEVINPEGTPYIYQNRPAFSIKADDIRPIKS